MEVTQLARNGNKNKNKNETDDAAGNSQQRHAKTGRQPLIHWCLLAGGFLVSDCCCCWLLVPIATGRSIDVTFAISHTSYIITKYNTDKITAIMASVELTSTLDYAIAGLKVGCSLLLCVGLLSAVVCRLGARWWLLAEEWAAVDR